MATVKQCDRCESTDEDAWTFQEHAPADIRALLAEVRRGKAIEGLARRMRNVMQDVEWACEGLGWTPACPACSAEELLYPERREHEPDCKLAIVLADAAKLLGEENSRAAQ